MIVGSIGQCFDPVRMQIFSEGSDFISGSKKAHFGTKMCFFGLVGNIRAKISKVKVGKWMIEGPAAKFFESVRMQIYSEVSDIFLGSKKGHFGSKRCFLLLNIFIF